MNQPNNMGQNQNQGQNRNQGQNQGQGQNQEAYGRNNNPGQQNGQYRHGDWGQNQPRGMNNSGNQYGANGPYRPNPNGAPSPLYQSMQKKKSAIFPVLLSVFLTFSLTTALIWGLAAQGVLPGTNRQITKADLPEGYEIGDFGLSVHTDDPEAQLAAEKLAKVIDTLQKNYFKVLSPAEMMEAMSQGVANSMDSKYTYYMGKEEVQAFNDAMNGNYSGIGATVSQNQDTKRFEIVSVVENGPAQKAGLQAGDIIMKVDGQSTEQFKTAVELANTVRGEEGTSVVLDVLRNNEEVQVTITRAQVTMELVSTRMLEDKIGYMHITEFASNLPSQFEKGMQNLLDQGAEHIVFDMRGNPGGSADAVVKVLDSLLPEGLIARIRGRQDGEIYEDSWEATEGTIVPDDMRYAILMNGSTASAAELFSGTLRDYDKATLIGDTSYGKGSGTVMYKLGDGTAVNVTIFNYYLPKGDMIEETGLEPDIPAKPVDKEFLSIPYYRLTPEQDDALAKALEELKK